MRALFYTLVLSAVLLSGIIILYRLEVEKPRGPALRNREPVASGAPLTISGFGEDELKDYGLEELYVTGVEFMEQWHIPEAIKVFEEVVRQDSLHLKAYIKLAECYADPLFCREELIEDCLKQSYALAADAQSGDTILVSALNNLYLAGDYEGAADKLRIIVRSERDNADARLLLAEALFNSGQFDDARDQIEVILRTDESHGRSRELLIKCLAAQGDVERAERLAKDMASLYPGEPYPYVLLSRVELQRGDLDNASEFCNNALNLDPRYIQAILAKGYLYAADGEMEAARVSFEKLLLFDDPVLASVAEDALAYVGFLSGRFDDAVDKMDEAIRLAMNSGSSRRAFYYAFKLVNYLCELGQGDAAEEAAKQWMSDAARIPLQLGRLRLDIFHGDLGNVEHVLNEIGKKPLWRRWMRLLNIDINEMLALTLIKENRYEDAIDALSHPNKTRSEGGSGYYFLGYAEFESGHAEQASTYFDQALRRRARMTFPYHENPIRYVQTLFYLAESSIARGDAGKAEEYYREFISHWGESAWELQAVMRAREKLQTLSGAEESG